MGAVTGVLGLGGGQSGTGVSGPQNASLMPGVSSGQINASLTNANLGLQQQENLLAALQGQNGLGNQSQVYNQLQGVANGTGPNPAQAQYQKNIQDLAKQQSGAISSVQGISPALAARMISQQGSAAMQNAAGQGGANLANQQLGAINAAGNMATTQAGQQIGQNNAYAASAQGEQNTLLGALGAQNQSSVANQSSINSANAGLAQGMMENTGKAIGGAFNAAGKAAAGAEGGMLTPSGFTGSPRSRIGQMLSKTPRMAEGGKVAALVSPGEGWIPPGKVGEVAKGKNPMVVMDRFPGKPKVPGNSYANDTLPRKLDVGGIVIPNEIMQSKDPAKGARDMVAGIIAKRRAKK